MMIELEREGHDSRAVANRFVLLAREHSQIITIMHLVKFVYLAHGWHWGYYDKPLICHNVEAWKYGPVVPDVYHAFRPQGIVMTTPVMQSAKPLDADFDSGAEALIGDVFKSYAKLSYRALSELTHEPGTPWDQVKNDGFYAKIPEPIIRSYYRNKVLERDKS